MAAYQNKNIIIPPVNSLRFRNNNNLSHLSLKKFRSSNCGALLANSCDRRDCDE